MDSDYTKEKHLEFIKWGTGNGYPLDNYNSDNIYNVTAEEDYHFLYIIEIHEQADSSWGWRMCRARSKIYNGGIFTSRERSHFYNIIKNWSDSVFKDFARRVLTINNKLRKNGKPSSGDR